METKIKNLKIRLNYLESKYLKMVKDLNTLRIVNFLSLGIIIGLILNLLFWYYLWKIGDIRVWM